MTEKSNGEKESYENYEKLLKRQDIQKLMEELKKKIEAVKKNVEKYKEKIIKKYSFIKCIGLLPPEASKIIEEEEEVEKREGEKLFHVVIVVPDENAKDVMKLKLESIQIVKDMKPKLWLHFYTVSELWQICFDGKYELIDAIAMSLPVFDTGLLAALRVATIHKIRVLKKFERYVVSYVLAGSIVRGEATKTSDVDVYIVIDDTDVKRMPRVELKERLRAIIYSYAIEANELANAKNKLSPQIYILTEFWEAVKEAHPVIFTFIRDGVPLYDRGAFMPWKLLLKMGKIKPSPEAIDMFMSLGERVIKTVRQKLNEIVTSDIYWGVITPSQAALMLYGIAPPTPRETVELMRKIFVEKEGLLEKKYVDILEKIVDIYKKYEHEKIKQISGKEVDSLLEQVSDYMERLKQLMDQIESRSRQNLLNQLKDTVFELLEKIFGKLPQQKLIEMFKKELISQGLIDKRFGTVLDKLMQKCSKSSKQKKKTKKEKSIKKDKDKSLEKHEFELLRKDVLELIKELREYLERKQILERLKTKILIETDKTKGEIIPIKDVIFVIPDVTKDEVLKYNQKNNEFEQSSTDELNQALSKDQRRVSLQLTADFLDALKQKVGKFRLKFFE